MSTKTTKPAPRSFACKRDDGTVIMLSVRVPTKRELDAADIEYSAEFNRCLLAGLPTVAKMIRSLRENEIWTTEDESQVAQLIENLRAAEKVLRATAEGSPDREKATDDFHAAQKKLNARQEEFKAMVAHTADTKADEAQRVFLMACVIEQSAGTDAGKRLFATVEDLQECEDQALLQRCSYEYMMLNADLPSEWDRLMAAQEVVADEKKEADKPPADQAEKKDPPAAPAEVPAGVADPVVEPVVA